MDSMKDSPRGTPYEGCIKENRFHKSPGRDGRRGLPIGRAGQGR